MSLPKCLTSLSLSIVLALVGGCASFEKNEMARVDRLPDVSQYQHKPSVYIDFRFFRGASGDAKAVEISQARTQLLPLVEKVVKDSALFSRYTFDEFEKDKADYTIQLYSYNSGDGNGVLAFLCGFTFGLIPAAATDDYTLNTRAIAGDDTPVDSLESKDGITTWMGLWFLPVMGNTPLEALSNTFENQVRHALKNLVEKGSLKYSSRQPATHRA